ncbi:MAG TPA: Nre family DNA repair protein [Candidatus Thermoplasmatota archaeon]|nr:Nre family DNA repair protein [Candidatus Thermoplasmatota archaeon]
MPALPLGRCVLPPQDGPSPTQAARDLGIPPELCVRCKAARLLCGLPRCPILDRVREMIPAPAPLRGRELYGPSPPSLFVGRHGYPTVRAGPMVAPGADAPARLDAPREWVGGDVGTILGLRSGLLRSRRLVPVARPDHPVVAAAQLLAQAERPAAVEVTLAKDPPASLRSSIEGFAAPLGPAVEALTAKVVDNPAIPRKVDALVSDTDARAEDAATELYRSGIDAYHIQRLLSSGQLGAGHRRRLVPTRWSITATDDILGKRLIEQAKGFQEIGEATVHSFEHLGNSFHVLLLPREWSFEMLESWQRGAMWAPEDAAAADWEPYEGRTSYADNVTGAYYAARLSVLERLERLRRQAAVVVYREISPAYWAELGVWVIREGVRRAMEEPPQRFPGVEAAVAWIRSRVRRQAWDAESVLLDRFFRQRRITDYFG